MPTAPRISSSVFRAAACAQRGTPGSASVSPTPDESDCRSIEGHSHVPTGVTPRIGGIAVAVARGSVCPDSIRQAYRPTKGVSGSHTWCLMRGGEKLWRARLPLPFIGQFNPRLCFFYPADSEKAGPSAVSSTCDATGALALASTFFLLMLPDHHLQASRVLKQSPMSPFALCSRLKRVQVK